MKKCKVLIFATILALSLTACGASDMATISESYSSDSYTSSITDTNGLSVGYDYGYDEYGYEEEYVDTESDESFSDVEDTVDSSKDVSNQKLVYTADIEIDTLNFQESCNALFDAVDAAGGFIESKYLSDDGGDRYYYYEDDNRDVLRHNLVATVRIPSDKYQEFMDSTSSLGNVRSSTENVTNMTRQYGTLKSQLEIYEVEYQNYMEMLAEVESDEAKLQIKSELTDITIQISDIKNNMSYIDVNVDYSEITVQIQEVSKYTVVKEESTFLTRLADTFETSLDELGLFLEDLLFTIILNWYKWLFTLFMLWLVYRAIRAIIRKIDKKNDKNKQPNTFVVAPTRTGKSGGTVVGIDELVQDEKSDDELKVGESQPGESMGCRSEILPGAIPEDDEK